MVIAARRRRRLPAHLAPQVGDGILEPGQLAAQQVEFGAAQRDHGRRGRAFLGLEGGRSGLDLLALVRRMVRAELRVIAITARLARS